MKHIRMTMMAALVAMSGAAMAQNVEVMVLDDYLKMGWGTVSGEVKFGDLNLKTDAGVATLNSRVQAEGKRICASATSDNERRTCMSAVEASARPEVEKAVAKARGM
jgi:UrcA family protein